MANSSAKRYVQALVELAREDQSFDAWQRDLGVLRDAVSDEDVRRFLDNPGVSATDKANVLDSVLADAQSNARNLAQMLVQRRRTGLAGEIADRFDEAVLLERGIALVDVSTAEPLSQDNQELVKVQLKRLLGKDIELRLHEDPSIIGGFVARAGDQVIDGSVINKLRRLRVRLGAA